jgi:GDP-L-fucose synthase
MIEARDAASPSVEIWGTGKVSREFLYVEDCAEGLVLAAERLDNSEPVNIGTGSEITISDLASIIAKIVGYKGSLVFNPAFPDGQPRRCLDVSRAAERLGFKARMGLEEGLRKTIAWFEQENRKHAIREIEYR